jgi:hypothetical protein
MSVRRVVKDATEWAIVTDKGTINRFPFNNYDSKGNSSWSVRRMDALDAALKAFIRWSHHDCSISKDVELVER